MEITLSFYGPEGLSIGSGSDAALSLLAACSGVERFWGRPATDEAMQRIERCVTDELRRWDRRGGLPILAGTHPQVPAFEAAVAAGANPAEAARQILEFDVDGTNDEGAR